MNLRSIYDYLLSRLFHALDVLGAAMLDSRQKKGGEEVVKHRLEHALACARQLHTLRKEFPASGPAVGEDRQEEIAAMCGDLLHAGWDEEVRVGAFLLLHYIEMADLQREAQAALMDSCLPLRVLATWTLVHRTVLSTEDLQVILESAQSVLFTGSDLSALIEEKKSVLHYATETVRLVLEKTRRKAERSALLKILCVRAVKAATELDADFYHRHLANLLGLLTELGPEGGYDTLSPDALYELLFLAWKLEQDPQHPAHRAAEQIARDLAWSVCRSAAEH